jgi:mono/diheme cytochrome c family protein
VIQPAASLAEEGAQLFESKGCTQCHYTKSAETRIGPGLQGLFGRDKLPVSGRRVTEKNVRRQLQTPYENMPSFADRLTKEQRDRLIEYLKTL